MTDKLELKSCHEVIDTVSVADVDSIFYGKPIDPDILTVVMKNGKRLYCDEVCPINSLQKEPISEKKCMFTKDSYTDEDRKVICYNCKEKREYSKKEEHVSEDTMTIRKEWFEHCKESWYNEGYIDGKYNRDRQFKEPVSEELEKAAFDYAEACKYDGGEKLLCVEHFKAGAKLQKEQLIKEAIEGTARPDDNEIWCNLSTFNFKDGDKCKVILIKEDLI